MATDLEQKAADLARTMDPKEQTERVEAADAYAKEDEAHFVEYGRACFDEAEESTKDIRREQDRCMDAYRLQRNSEKEDWQCDIVTPMPFNLVQHAKSIIRKALVDRPDYYSIKGIGKEDKFLADFYSKTFEFHANENHGNFPLAFAGAAEMAFVCGQSMEMIPRWEKKFNGTESLKITLAQPRHIHRDPVSDPTNPWSGMFWIHSEFMDKWELMQGQDDGIYQNISEAFSSGREEQDKEKEARRRQYIVTKNAYRSSLKVHEFWGIVLDKKGELLLPNATFSWAGKVIVRKPRSNPYPTIRWPGVGFSAIPDLLRWEGRGILSGVMSLWNFYDNLLNAFGDDMNWVVNRMFELEPTLLADRGADSETYPGKTFIRSSGTPSGSQAVREIITGGSKIRDVLPTLNHFDTLIQTGSFLPHFITGIPGNRSNITKGEFEGKRQDSSGMFDSIGKDVEMGAVWAIRAILDVITINWTQFSQPGLSDVLGEPFVQFAKSLSLALPEERAEALKMNSDIKVSGISELLRKNDTLQQLDLLMRRVEAKPEIWLPMSKPHNMLKSVVDLLGLSDEDLVKTDEELATEQAQQAAALAAQNQQAGLVGESLNKAGLKTPGGPASSGGRPQPGGLPNAGIR